MHQQLTGSEKEEYERIKAALISAFATDKFLAYEQFVARKLRDGEPVALLNRARAVLADDTLGVGSPTHVSCLSQHAAVSASCCSAVRCLYCNQPNHYARDCLAGRGARRGGRGRVRCCNCGRRGHIASTCSGNASGEVSSALASSLHHQ
ncbi:hypothetical protein O3P69_018220 [Scylla paramamosain]|uniref:CCHC-type domain-containing protein n=1 Tax=Scylla paramamosain TaxID=85552 RepID=A0AAW0TLK5_SCYPA